MVPVLPGTKHPDQGFSSGLHQRCQDTTLNYVATASNQLLTDTKSTNATGSKPLIHRSIDPSIYRATSPSGYWPLSEDTSTLLCLPLVYSILLFLWSVMCPSGRLPPILFLVSPLLWATNGFENYINKEELISHCFTLRSISSFFPLSPLFLFINSFHFHRLIPIIISLVDILLSIFHTHSQPGSRFVECQTNLPIRLVVLA